MNFAKLRRAFMPTALAAATLGATHNNADAAVIPLSVKGDVTTTMPGAPPTVVRNAVEILASFPSDTPDRSQSSNIFIALGIPTILTVGSNPPQKGLSNVAFFDGSSMAINDNFSLDFYAEGSTLDGPNSVLYVNSPNLVTINQNTLAPNILMQLVENFNLGAAGSENGISIVVPTSDGEVNNISIPEPAGAAVIAGAAGAGLLSRRRRSFFEPNPS